MSYSIKEIYLTLQGEGAQSGRPAVFCRFAGCNLWNGIEQDRQTAICQFCDTDFLGTDGPGGGTFETAENLVESALRLWPNRSSGKKYVVCTGGEPLLQLDENLVESFHAKGFEVGVETNATLTPPEGIDWICVSPKKGTKLKITHGDELKLVYPQRGAEPELYEEFEFEHFFLQPMDGPELEANTSLAIDYCLSHPQWKLSLQTHKFLGLP